VAVWVRRKVVVGIVVAAVVAGSTAIVVVQTENRVQLPPKTASPEQVLRVYLRAAKAHDCTLTVALSVGSDERAAAFCGGGSFLGLSNHPNLVSYKSIGAIDTIPASDTGRFAEQCIPVDIRETGMNGADPGEIPGWEFCFRRTSAGWRIADEGQG
jgi:hypothetical protein